MLTPWRRAPLLLLRRPGVAVALVAAAFVATLPAAAAPLFLSSAQNATLHRDIASACPWVVGVRVGSTLELFPTPEWAVGTDYLTGDKIYQRRDDVVTKAAATGLSTPVVTLIGEVNADPVTRPSADPNTRGLNLIGSSDFAGHVEVVEGPLGSGIWVPDQFAAAQGLKVGDELKLTRRSQRAFQARELPEATGYEVKVAAIFRDLRSLPDQPHWCSVRDHYRGRPGQEFTNEPIFPMALIDADSFVAAGTAMQLRAIHTIEYSVADPVQPAPEAAALASRITEMQRRVLTDDKDVLGTDFINRTTVFSVLDRAVQRADLVRKGLLPPVVPITAAGTAIGLAVVAAAAVFWVQRRRQELAVLSAHGVGAPALGYKGVLESLPAILVGAAGGWSSAWALVRWTGPGQVLSADAVPRSMLAAVATTVIALLLVGTVAAARSRAFNDQTPVTQAPRFWGRLPWELLPFAAAPAAWFLLADDRTGDVGAGTAGEVAHVPARLLVVPILVITGTVLLIGRLGVRRLRRTGLTRTPRRPTALLAWRRIVRDATTTALLAAATAAPIAMAAYGAAVTDSIRTTADAEVRMLLGSDVVATFSSGRAVGPILEIPPPPPALVGRSTQVTRISAQRLGNLTVDVLAVDPTTFASGAFWDDRIPGPTLADAAAELGTGPVATVVASGNVDLGPATLTLLGTPVPIDVVSARRLPGEQAGYPVLLVHKDVVEGDPAAAGRQLWIRGNPTEIQETVGAARLPLARMVSADDLRGGALYEPVTYTIQYLIALSVFTGLIAVVGLLLYLESRTAAHRRAYVLLRRLGLKAGAHRRALLVELAVPVLIGLVIGIGLAAGLAFGLGDYFEIDKSMPPGTILVLPYAMTGLVTATALVVAIGAALLAHRRISRAKPAEVLRDVV